MQTMMNQYLQPEYIKEFGIMNTNITKHSINYVILFAVVPNKSNSKELIVLKYEIKTNGTQLAYT